MFSHVFLSKELELWYLFKHILGSYTTTDQKFQQFLCLEYIEL